MKPFYSYIVAVLEGHVVPTVPYISDAATYSPESCIFGQLINIGSVLCECLPNHASDSGLGIFKSQILSAE